ANLASLGILTVCFGHEASEFCNLAAGTAVELRSDFLAGKFMVTPEIEQEILKDIQVIVESTKFVKNFAAFSLGNVRSEKRKVTALNISTVATRVFDALKESLDRQKITVDCGELPNNLASIKAYEIDWESIFVNMISNSIWAMSRTPAELRRIKVSGQNVEGGVRVRFSDSGHGIEKGAQEHIFNPMFSTRRDDKGNSVGTGMGLSIVRTFVAEHSGGSIEVIPRGELGGAEFVIFVPAGGNE
ncbi:MAG: ATP-binding protein, partial [Marivirga sp.]|nr:ATP-binding protein [Marivirga sp.]